MGADPLENALQAGVTALGLAMDSTAQGRLLAYVALLQRWSQVYNLTAVRDPQAMLVQHVLDSLSVVPALERFRAHGRDACAAQPAPGGPHGPAVLPADAAQAPAAHSLRVADIGSGAGLPGLVLAAACPSLRVWCVDAVAKKVSFIRQAAAELGLASVQAVHTRVEDWADPEARGFDLVVSRAFASLQDFVGGTDHLLAPRGVWLAMKGRHPTEEIAALPEDVEVFHVEPLQVPGLEAHRCLVWMKKRTL